MKYKLFGIIFDGTKHDVEREKSKNSKYIIHTQNFKESNKQQQKSYHHVFYAR